MPFSFFLTLVSKELLRASKLAANLDNVENEKYYWKYHSDIWKSSLFDLRFQTVAVVCDNLFAQVVQLI